jgi:hypothetical protein
MIEIFMVHSIPHYFMLCYMGSGWMKKSESLPLGLERSCFIEDYYKIDPKELLGLLQSEPDITPVLLASHEKAGCFFYMLAHLSYQELHNVLNLPVQSSGHPKIKHLLLGSTVNYLFGIKPYNDDSDPFLSDTREEVKELLQSRHLIWGDIVKVKASFFYLLTREHSMFNTLLIKDARLKNTLNEKCREYLHINVDGKKLEIQYGMQKEVFVFQNEYNPQTQQTDPSNQAYATHFSKQIEIISSVVLNTPAIAPPKQLKSIKNEAKAEKIIGAKIYPNYFKPCDQVKDVAEKNQLASKEVKPLSFKGALFTNCSSHNQADDFEKLSTSNLYSYANNV